MHEGHIVVDVMRVNDDGSGTRLFDQLSFQAAPLPIVLPMGKPPQEEFLVRHNNTNRTTLHPRGHTCRVGETRSLHELVHLSHLGINHSTKFIPMEIQSHKRLNGDPSGISLTERITQPHDVGCLLLLHTFRKEPEGPVEVLLRFTSGWSALQPLREESCSELHHMPPLIIRKLAPAPHEVVVARDTGDLLSHIIWPVLRRNIVETPEHECRSLGEPSMEILQLLTEAGLVGEKPLHEALICEKILRPDVSAESVGETNPNALRVFVTLLEDDVPSRCEDPPKLRQRFTEPRCSPLLHCTLSLSRSGPPAVLSHSESVVSNQ